MATSAIAAFVLLVGAGPAAAASINVSPTSVPAGGSVTVSGSASPGCGQEKVTLHSKAFSHENDFAGLPAIFATSEANGDFSVSTQIPSNRAPGTYTIGGRCGGGNLGVQASLQVTAASSGTLPRTGSDAWLLAGLGVCLAAGGVALRRRLAAS
jgi:LPXTG-motif cell wall-anchored protein